MSNKLPSNLFFPNLIPIRKVGNLKCPDCTDLMLPFSCQNVVVDKCSACNGLWFDHNEFGVFKRTLDGHDLSKIIKIHKPEDPESEILSVCPRCEICLYEVDYSYKSGIKVKKCDRCKGLWLPIHQALNLIGLAKLSQAIAPDVKGLNKELHLLETQRRKHGNLKKAASPFNQPVSYWKYSLSKFFPIMLPLYDENPQKTFPLASMTFIFLNILLYFLVPSRAYQDFALQPNIIVQFKDLQSLFTSMFMHAGLLHLLGNIYFLWLFGDNVEEKMGTRRFVFFYIGCGVIAGLTQVMHDPSSTTGIIGASGAISGILGAYLYLFPQVNIKTLVVGHIVDLPTWTYLGFWIGMQCLFSYLQAEGGVAWWAHIGGFIFGWIFNYVTAHFFQAKSDTTSTPP